MARKIAYIVPRFPSLYQGYINEEVAALAGHDGLDISVFSLKNPKRYARLSRPHIAPTRTYYSSFVPSIRVLTSHAYYLRRRPRAYIRLLRDLMKHTHGDVVAFLKALCVFPKAVHYARLIELNDIAHVHAHWASTPALVAWIVSELTLVPYSVSAHAIDIFQNTTMLEEKLKKAQFIVTCTAYNKFYLISRFGTLAEDRICVCYHGSNLEKLQRNGNERRDIYDVLSVGRIEESKGYEYLVRACAALKQRGISVRCTIVGDGPLRRRIESLRSRLDLDGCVHITGELPYSEVIEYYRRATLFVLPAVSEHHWGIPNVLIEAMAMELPVITTPLPAVGEVIRHGENGVIVQEKDVSGLADAMEKLLASAELRQLYGTNARRSVECSFDSRKTLKELVGIFERSIGRE